MIDNAIFGQTIDIAAKALDLRSRRHEMILSNIANADTPEYKSFDLMVEAALQRSSGMNPENVKLKQTQPGHLSPKGVFRADLQEDMIRSEAMASLRGDGNTVDMEREMSNLAANKILYKAAAQILYKKFEGLKSAIQGGRQ